MEMPTPPMEEPFTKPTPEISFPEFDVQSMNTPPPVPDNIFAEPAQTSQGSFNSIAGMTVFDEEAKKIGTVKQVGVDSTQSVVLVITRNDGGETTIKWNQIKKIGEIILLGEGGSAAPTIQQTSAKCPSCGFDNK